MQALVLAGKYSDARGLARKPEPVRPTATRPKPTRKPIGAPGLLIPKGGKLPAFKDVMWRELREGGHLHDYLARERSQETARVRAVAKQMEHCNGTNKTDMKPIFALPMRDAMRLLQNDPHFFDDDWNLKFLKRHNPDLKIFI